MIIWNANPEIFTLGTLAPRWYGLCFALGFFLGEKWVVKYLEKKDFTKDECFKLFMYLLAGTIFGARLAHCLFYEPGHYLSNPLEILYVWQGGLASHGGFAGVIIAVWRYSKKVKKLDFLWLLDLVAAPTVMTGGFIRLGNLMNSEIIGKPTDLPWAFIFKRVDNIPRHPTQLYEAFGYLAVAAFLFYAYKKNYQTWPKGRFAAIGIICAAFWRFLTEFLKENQVRFEQDMTFNMGQILSVLIFTFGIYLLIKKDEKQ